MPSRGIAHHAAQLTPEKVQQIRASYASPPDVRPTMAEIGQRFGISAAAVHNVVHRISWADVPDNPSASRLIRVSLTQKQDAAFDAYKQVHGLATDDEALAMMIERASA